MFRNFPVVARAQYFMYSPILDKCRVVRVEKIKIFNKVDKWDISGLWAPQVTYSVVGNLGTQSF